MRLTGIALVSASLANVASSVGTAARTSPVDKVITLITDLRNKVSAEGTEEATTYDKFACFCKDTMAEKSTAISEGETNKESLQAAVNQASSRRDQEDIAMAEKQKAIQKLEEEIKTMKQDRHAEALTYAKSEVDLTHAIQGLEQAIRALKAAKTATGLVELKKMSKTLRQAVSIAAVLSPGSAVEHATAALTQLREVPTSIYEFHAADVISTLEGLKTEFDKKKTDLDEAETSARKTYLELLQTKEGEIETHTGEFEKHQKNKAKEAQDITVANRDLTVSSATLLDDQAYLTDLGTKCNEKGLMWDQRTRARENELVAMTRVLGILQSADVSPKSQEAAEEPSLVQLETMAAPAHRVARSPGNSARLAEVSSAVADPLALVQLEEASSQLQHFHLRLRGGRNAGPGADWRSAAAALLRADAGKLHAPLFLRLASQVSDDKDPFDKVKVLIQELIERLLKEAASEADHKGWCDKQISAAEQERGHSADAINEVNERLEASEARRAKLTMQVKELDKELNATKKELEDSTKIRDQEKTQNAKAVEDAKKGKQAMIQAIDVLDKYYKEAANNAKALLQQKAHVANARVDAPGGSVDDDAPDAGFSDAYEGATSAKDGIIGMLQVIQSDFEQTVASTEKAEAKAQEEYNELQTTAGSSVAAKTVAKDARAASLADANREDSEDRTSLTNHQKSLDNVLTELEALQKPCLDGGMSADERKLQREQEMEALKQVLCILDQHSTGSFDSC